MLKLYCGSKIATYLCVLFDDAIVYCIWLVTIEKDLHYYHLII